MNRGTRSAVAVLLGAIQVSGVWAADSQAAKYFGRAVHEINQGRYEDAIRDLDLAAGYDERDPRIYFFRGIAKLRTGRDHEATADFQIGSQLEVALARTDVGRSLQRIQGPDRLTLERYRREARLLSRDVARQMIPRPVGPATVRTPQPAPSVPPRQAVVENLPDAADDPFRDDAPGFLGRGDLTPSRVVADDAPTAPAGADLTADEPVGTGVAPPPEPGFDDTEADEASDPFAMDADSAPAPPPAANAPPTVGPPAAGPKKPGALGAALRAFTRGLTPTLPVPQSGQQMLRGLRGGGPATPPAGAPEPDDVSRPAAPAEVDNALEDDPFGEPAGEPAEPSMPADAADDADDPFQDDTN